MRRWRHGVFVCLSALIVGSCTDHTPDNRWAFVCSDGYAFTVTYPYAADVAIFEDGAGPRTLDQQTSGSGVRYGDGNIEFRNKGTAASITKGDQTIHAGCKGIRQG